MLLLGMLFLFSPSTTSAQQSRVLRTHSISTPTLQQTQVPTTGTLNVVAVMVQFQPDTNRLTSGTGIFGNDGMEGLPYLSNQTDTRIDPLPHNQQYFESHLEFAKNYFEKSSDDQLTLNYTVLPGVFTLPKKMEEYSPIGEEFTLDKLGDLLNDTWTAVEDAGGFNATGLDPENTAFVIFHAGVGRDIELTGTSLDITPYDIPSIYLRKQDLQNIFENPSFSGFPINGGAFRVTNSLIIPRTESRRAEDISGNEVVFPLSINGLLCASIGSHLGLPDLFNTDTGEPAIGRFGLMDGAGFFAYNGLLPPEPSAWEKIYLGWETPFEITPQTDGAIYLPATSLDQPNSIAKLSLSSSEYFLIENRHRDPENDGLIITIRTPDGTEVQQSFTNNDSELIYQESDFDTLLTAGTIIDVDNFDFSLPGGLEIGDDEEEGTADDRELNGGILIWQIDEAIINQKLASGGINADPLRRGVDLEEADGAQDIGRDVGLLDNSSSFGYAYDFWWSDNNYRVITETTTIDLNPDNQFGPDTYPDNRSNSGAPSFFELYEFSDILPVASFRIRSVSSVDTGYEQVLNIPAIASNTYTTDNDYWNFYPLSIGFYSNTSDTLVVVPGSANIYFTDYHSGTAIQTISTISNQQPILGDQFILASNPTIEEPLSPGNIRITEHPGVPNNLSAAYTITSPPNGAFISTENGSVIHPDFTETSYEYDGTSVNSFDAPAFRSEAINNSYAEIDGNLVRISSSNDSYGTSYTDRLYVGTIQTIMASNQYFVFEDGAFRLIDPTSNEFVVTIFEEDNAEWPAISDSLEIFRINKQENVLEGYNRYGALLHNMPVSAPNGFTFIGTPLLADITGDNEQDILVVTQDDYSVNIFAYEMDGTAIQGFPLYVGESLGSNIQPIHPAFFENTLFAVSHTGDLKSWRFNNFTTSVWPSRYGDNPYNKISARTVISTTSSPSFSVLNKTETYNWPNPARDETNIRFELAAPGGNVDITIIDLTGRVIYETTVSARGGAPEEITLDTRSWGSGAYLAMIKAEVDGKTESKLIKIGVVH
tara:strand:+ start:38108 stop:41257 length:3150 start_codon:yes stop_codon:yes gene_type:complete